MDPIKNLKSIAKSGEDEKVIESLYVVMKTFGYRLKDLIGEEKTHTKEFRIFNWKIGSFTEKIKTDGMPLPHFNYLLKMIEKEKKMEEKEIKKARAKGR